MKVSVNDVELYTINETQFNVLKNYIPATIIDEDLKRRLFWILNHLYDQAFIALKKEWEQKLADRGVQSIPTDKDAFAQLVFSQADYRSRSQRDLETNV
jgi:hypothetical protein